MNLVHKVTKLSKKRSKKDKIGKILKVCIGHLEATVARPVSTEFPKKKNCRLDTTEFSL